VRRVTCTVALLVVATAPLASAARNASPTALPDCVGKPQVKPASVILTCADAGLIVGKLKWTGWGSPFAAATGTETVNDCKPYCAAGHFHSYPVVIAASGSQRCPGGVTAYKTVLLAFVVKNPTIAAAPSTWFFRCR
jgi:hypothetical protein